MLSPNAPPRQMSAGLATPMASEGSYVDWPAILAGGIFAMAISFLLISFGAGLGLSLTSPYSGEGVSTAWVAIAAGIWFAWVMVTGFGAGGYIAGRMRRRAEDATPSEVEARDGVHGLLVWATGALVGTIMATLGVGGLLTAGASAVGTVGDIAGEATSEAVSSDYFANLMLRGASTAPEPEATAPTTEPATDTAGTAAPATDTTDTAAPGADTTDTAAPPLQTTAQPAATAIDPAVQQQIAGILMRSAAEGEMAERDSAYLAQLVAANTELDQTAARARVDEINAEIAEARAATLAAIEKARVTGVVFGFIAAATLLIGAVAAFFAAAAGGRHRDEGLGLDVLTARH